MIEPTRDSDATGLRPDRLLDHPRQLGRRGTDTATPRTVHARRAVSAAYYALFHRITINLARGAVALAWLAQQPTVAAPIASARTIEQLDGLLPVLALELSRRDLAALAEASA